MPGMTITEQQAFGERLRAARDRRGWSLQRVVRELTEFNKDVDPSTIARLERGATSERGANTMLVAALAVIYGVPLQSLSEFHAEVRDRFVRFVNEDLKQSRSERRDGAGVGGESAAFTNGLKARCSAIELATLVEVTDLHRERAA